MEKYPRNNALSFSGLGDAYRESGRFEDALRLFECSIKLSPSFSYLHNGKGACLFALGRKEEAVQAFNEAISNSVPMDDQDGWAHCYLDIIFFQSGMKSQAMAERQAALASSPKDAWQHFDLGSIYEKNGLNDAALAQFQEAVRQFPWYAEAYDRLGHLFEKRSEFDKSVESFQKAVSLEPQNKAYREHLISSRNINPPLSRI